MLLQRANRGGDAAAAPKAAPCPAFDRIDAALETRREETSKPIPDTFSLSVATSAKLFYALSWAPTLVDHLTDGPLHVAYPPERFAPDRLAATCRTCEACLTAGRSGIHLHFLVDVGVRALDSTRGGRAVSAFSAYPHTTLQRTATE